MNPNLANLKRLVGLVCLLGVSANLLAAMPVIRGVDRQPLVSATKRLIDTLQFVGAPLSDETMSQVQAAMRSDQDQEAIEGIQRTLDPLCLAVVNINPESRVKVAEGPVAKELIQNGWRTFLIKVHNEAEITPQLIAESPNAAPQYKRSSGSPDPKSEITLADVADRWLDLTLYTGHPLKPELSGLEVEYRIIQIYSRDTGKREAILDFNVGQGTQDLGFRNQTAILFDCQPAVKVVLRVRDFDGQPTSAGFVVRDSFERVYPNPARRLAPDFFFHDQVYRADGEFIELAPGDYTVTITRGPEYFKETHEIVVKEGVDSQTETFDLKRWIHPASMGWYSGDHHVHAAGCGHYENPTEGVSPADMMRHILGEDLNVGCVLSWGPCWYNQKQYFDGKVSPLSQASYLMRYDVEVSGFPSSHAGHLCLLRLYEDDYPGTTRIEQWPSWTLPVLSWGKEQGGVVGYSHSGWGLALPDVMPDGSRSFTKRPWGGAGAGWDGKAADTLPDYAMPRFDGIGANEFIVTVAHDVCDFISSVDTPAVWELNIWYHILNSGFRTVISGETDFPCIYGDKVGLGRVYVELDKDVPLDFDRWIMGLKEGRSYCGDGMSHVFDFRVNDVVMGQPGNKGRLSELELEKPTKVKVSFDVSAMLEAQPNDFTNSIRSRRLDEKPYWHVERARLEDTRKVPVELIVNGYPVETRELVADGHIETMDFEVDVPYSSWFAVRIFPTVHTNPIFVTVDDKPIRASRRSAEWCMEAVEVCWDSKKNQIQESERSEARAAYDAAKAIYRKILSESVAD